MHRTARISALLLATSPSRRRRLGRRTPASTPSTGCDGWVPYNWRRPSLTRVPQCPGFVVRNIGGNFSSPVGAEAGWIFSAPAGTNIERALDDRECSAATPAGRRPPGPRAAAAPAARTSSRTVPGACCPGRHRLRSATYPVPSAAVVRLRVRCGASSCPNSALNGAAELQQRRRRASTTAVPPSVRIAGGALVERQLASRHADRRRRGERQHWHPARSARTSTGRSGPSSRGRRAPGARSYPCPNGGGTIAVDTTGLSDGPHRSPSRPSTPAAPRRTDSRRRSTSTTSRRPHRRRRRSTAGTAGARRTSSRSAGRIPPQNAAPDRRRGLPLLPSRQRRRVRSASTASVPRTAGQRRDEAPACPAPGDWDATRLAASTPRATATPASATPSTTCGFDPTPPTATHRAARRRRPDAHPRAGRRTSLRRSPAARSRCSATARASGGRSRRESSPDGLAATIDDSKLPDGSYRIRARVVDAAGNERSTQTRQRRRRGGARAAAADQDPARGRQGQARPRPQPRAAASARYRRILVDRAARAATAARSGSAAG